MDEKKKLMVLGAMGVVLLGIGAIQFSKSSSHAAAPAPAVTASTPSATTVASNADGKDGAGVPPQQNNLVTGSYPEHDPFKPVVADTLNIPPQQNPIPTHLGSHPLPIEPCQAHCLRLDKLVVERQRL